MVAIPQPPVNRPGWVVSDRPHGWTEPIELPSALHVATLPPGDSRDSRVPKDTPNLARLLHGTSAAGQKVIVGARWLLVIAGSCLAFWAPASAGQLRAQLFIVMAVAVSNFWLHTHVLRERAINGAVLLLVTGADLFLITLLVMGSGGYPSELYVYYLPALLAASVALPVTGIVAVSVSTISIYVLIGLATLRDELELMGLFVRVAALVGVVLCGAMYQGIEAARRARGTSASNSNKDDLFFGQMVSITARWVVIATGATLALLAASTVAGLGSVFSFVAPVMAFNFWLHGRYVLGRPGNALVTYLAAAFDVVLILAAVRWWPGGAGVESQWYVLLAQVLVAFAFVFPARRVAQCTVIVTVLYVVVCFTADPAQLANHLAWKTLGRRLLPLAGAAGIAAYYWRMQRAADTASPAPESLETASEMRAHTPASDGAMV